MNRALVAAALTLATLTGCGKSQPKLSESYCSDLRAGMSPPQILRARYDDPQEIADMAYGFASISCPDQLDTNEQLRTFLQGWDINPDA